MGLAQAKGRLIDPGPGPLIQSGKLNAPQADTRRTIRNHAGKIGRRDLADPRSLCHFELNLSA